MFSLAQLARNNIAVRYASLLLVVIQLLGIYYLDANRASLLLIERAGFHQISKVRLGIGHPVESDSLPVIQWGIKKEMCKDVMIRINLIHLTLEVLPLSWRPEPLPEDRCQLYQF